MSIDSSWDVQTALYTRLTAATALTAQLAGGADSILDHVPAGTPFPYVVMGEMEARPLETQGVAGSELTLTLHSYSRGAGFKEVRSIMASINTSLHNANFAVPNQVLVLCRWLQSETRLEEDGLTRHGIQRFQVITEIV
jgi:hypothetical protein